MTIRGQLQCKLQVIWIDPDAGHWQACKLVVEATPYLNKQILITCTEIGNLKSQLQK